MNKSKIQKFAVDGHKLLYKQIAQRAYQYGIEEGNVGKADATEVRGRILSPLEKSQRAALIAEINANGYPQTIERVTYIWFNRIVALRFMEVNNYLPSHIRVFSDASGAFKPEILNDVLHLEMEGLDKAQIAEYIENNNTEELYRYLLLTQCAELKAALPDIFVFGARDRDYTELLFPNNSLSGDSFIAKMLSETDEKEDWQDAIQIIGWLYQYYNDERKNEVININKGSIKKEDIPAATQLFTTDWVVRYMVDNSLGRYWIERHPESKLAEKLEFFVTPKKGEIKHIDGFVKPEDIKFLDPCMGSGHILVYAFDVLMEIYKESGYTERDAAAMIVQNNLFGLDIDDRAAQLAYFAVMMKARSYDRRFLSRGIKPNVLAIKESNRMSAAIRDGLTADAAMNAISLYLVDTFRDAKELGSIITVESKDYDTYMAYLDGCDGQGQLTMDDADWLQNTRPMLKALARQAKVLAAKYPVVCTNPPYLNKIEGRLKTFVTENYKDYSGDLFSVFTYRNLMFCKQDGYYRHFHYAFGNSLKNANDILEDGLKHSTEFVEALYQNWFLRELTACWTNAAADDLATLDYVSEIEKQRDFYKRYVAPASSKNTRAFVIISDALRYEVASELSERIVRTTKGTAELESMQAIFPSITKFGMAALLPGKSISVNDSMDVLVDGNPTRSTVERNAILNATPKASVAIQYNDLLNMKKDERRELVAGKDVIYIYHNSIDAIGDKAPTESKVFDACETAIQELSGILRIIVNELSGTNIFITADHGFLYTYKPLSESDKIDRKAFSGNVYELGRRYALTAPDTTADFLLPVNLERELDGTPIKGYAPQDTIRMKVQGGGENYVHGGISLQELVVPVIAFKNLRTTYKNYVEVKNAELKLLSESRKISNLIFSLEFHQRQPVGDRIQPCTYSIYMTDDEGVVISDRQTVIADKTSDNAADRVFRVRFNLKARTYDKKKVYRLVIANEIDVEEIEFHIDIAFADDFGFDL